MKKSRLISVLLTLVFLVSAISVSSVFAATGVARVYYYTGTGSNGPGTTSTINSYLTNMGYSSVRVANSGPAVVTLALSTSKVVHILAHGQGGTTPGGGIQCVTGSGNPSDWIWANNLSSSMSQAKLIFFECCNCACTNPTNGRLDNKCISLGAQSTIAFTSEISAVGDTDGIHYFSRLVYYYLSLGNSVQSSVSSAQEGVWMYYGSYYGANNCAVNGGSTTIS